MPATVALNGTIPAADCIPAFANGSVPTSCQLVVIVGGMLKLVNVRVWWKSCSSLVGVPVGPAPPATTICRSSMAQGTVKLFKKQLPPVVCLPAAAPDLALGKGPAAVAVDVHPAPKSSYCQKMP